MLARAADDPLRILIDTGVVVNFGGVFLLGFNEAPADLDGIQFVCADPPVENLLLSLFRIENPLSISAHDWNWKRPIVVSNEKDGAFRVLRINVDNRLFTGLFCERFGILSVSHWVHRRDEVFAVGTENLQKTIDVVVCRARDQSFG